MLLVEPSPANSSLVNFDGFWQDSRLIFLGLALVLDVHQSPFLSRGFLNCSFSTLVWEVCKTDCLLQNSAAGVLKETAVALLVN